mmetsp:Transcript_1202/g.2614  ORF Transcript_1202/g.2614 Transcript_1202/m.2614 type:complete len:208 (-) Transcript_1202:110-733(-)
MAILQQLSYLRGKFSTRNNLGAGSDKTKQTEGGLFLHMCGGRFGHKCLKHLGVKRLDQLQTRNVGSGTQRQALRCIRRGTLFSTCWRWNCEILYHGGANRTHHWIVAFHQQTERGISHIFLRIIRRPQQYHYFGVAKIYIITENMNVHKLPNILLSRVGCQIGVASVLRQFSSLGREILANVGQLFVDTFLFILLSLGIPEVGNEVL